MSGEGIFPVLNNLCYNSKKCWSCLFKNICYQILIVERMNNKEIWFYILLDSVFIFLTSCKLTWYISFCNETHTETTESNKKIIREALPNLFQNNLLCAGVDIGTQGSCKGDSGGPLMLNNLATKRWTQIGTVQGAVGMPSFLFLYK